MMLSLSHHHTSLRNSDGSSSTVTLNIKGILKGCTQKRYNTYTIAQAWKYLKEILKCKARTQLIITNKVMRIISAIIVIELKPWGTIGTHSREWHSRLFQLYCTKLCDSNISENIAWPLCKLAYPHADEPDRQEIKFWQSRNLNRW